MKPTAPVVSVILPVRDARPYLDAAIVSLLSQTLEDFELIAVDDGSIDGSRQALDMHVQPAALRSHLLK